MTEERLACEEARRRAFAKAMARSAFGRHYWDEDCEQERRAAQARSKKQNKNKGGNRKPKS